MESKIQLPDNLNECPFMGNPSVMCVCFFNKSTKILFGTQYICYPNDFCKGTRKDDCDNCNKKQCKGR